MFKIGKDCPDVCPVPDPSKVDFVIIFTHDVDFFSTTMPEPVHKSNGFSDFTPITPIDTALVPESEADKAHREYVWIFQFPKGTFDPASFFRTGNISSRRWKQARWVPREVSRRSRTLSDL